MKKLCIQAGKMILAGFLAVCILNGIDLVYEYNGVHVDNAMKDTDYVWMPGQYKANLTEGFSYLVMDRNGYNNTAENAEKAEERIDILLMGSSHVEAAQVAYNENMGYLLNEDMPEMNTYSIGMSGHDIYRITDNLSYALERFSPEKYLVIECFDVALDQASMLQILDGSGQRLTSNTEGLVAKMQQIPAVKWIYKEASTWDRLERKQKRLAKAAAEAKKAEKKAKKEQSAQNNADVESAQETKASSAERTLPDGYYETLRKFLSVTAIQCEKSGCKPIIFYHPTGMFLQNGNAYFQADELYLEAFSKACEENGILFVDMTDSFLAEYNTNHRFPHGFANTAVATGHLNAVGHRLIATELEKIIKEDQKYGA